MKSWKTISALPALALAMMLALSAALQGCNWGSSPEGGGTEGEGLSGIVVDPRGKAVANARVRVFPEPGSALGRRLAAQAAAVDSMHTDGRGRYAFDSLPSGDYALLATVSRNDSVLTVLVRDIAYEGGDRDLGLHVLKAAGSVSLTVRWEGGVAVAGARCSIAGLEGFEATSDVGGECVLTNLPEGTFRVRVTHPTENSTVLSAPVRVQSGKTVAGGDVEIDPGPAPVDTLPVDTLPPGAQQIALIADADTYVNRSSTSEGAHLGNNFGASTGFLVGVYDLYTIPTGLLHFTLPSNVPAARIIKAVVRVHSFGWTTKNVHPATVSVRMHSVLREWKEGSGNGTANSAVVDGVTARERFWGTQNGAEDWGTPSIGFDNADASLFGIDTVTQPNLYNGAWDFEITALAKTWASVPTQNFGVLLRVDVPATNEAVQDYPAFYSRESAVPDSLKPRLILTLSP